MTSSAKASEKPLTPKQQRFVEEYLIDLNGTRAAIRAGYSQKTAFIIAYENLNKPYIVAAIAKAQDERSKRVHITQDDVLKEIAKLGFSNMLDYMSVNDSGLIFTDFSRLTRETAAAIQELVIDEYVEKDGDDLHPIKKTRFKIADKRGALELLGKHLGMFADKVDFNGSLEVVFVNNWRQREREPVAIEDQTGDDTVP